MCNTTQSFSQKNLLRCSIPTKHLFKGNTKMLFRAKILPEREEEDLAIALARENINDINLLRYFNSRNYQYILVCSNTKEQAGYQSTTIFQQQKISIDIGFSTMCPACKNIGWNHQNLKSVWYVLANEEDSISLGFFVLSTH